MYFCPVGLANWAVPVLISREWQGILPPLASVLLHEVDLACLWRKIFTGKILLCGEKEEAG